MSTKTTSPELTTKSPAETQALGAMIGKRLYPGMTISLSGELGAGKTTLVQGIARGSGYNGYVRSPTFILVNEYSGNLPIAHCDMYRISGDEVDELALEEHLDKGVLLVEWPEKCREIRNYDGLHVDISFGDTDDARTMSFKTAGKRPVALLNSLLDEWNGSQ